MSIFWVYFWLWELCILGHLHSLPLAPLSHQSPTDNWYNWQPYCFKTVSWGELYWPEDLCIPGHLQCHQQVAEVSSPVSALANLFQDCLLMILLLAEIHLHFGTPEVSYSVTTEGPAISRPAPKVLLSLKEWDLKYWLFNYQFIIKYQFSCQVSIWVLITGSNNDY